MKSASCWLENKKFKATSGIDYDFIEKSHNLEEKNRGQTRQAHKLSG